MNSVFTKTLLWFFGTVLLTMLALILAAVASFNTGQRSHAPLPALVELQQGEAIHAYETGGARALREALARFEESAGTGGVLTDDQGIDLATGEDRSELVRQVRTTWPMSFLGHHHSVLGRRSASGRYFYFMLLSRGNVVTWFLQPQVHLLILGLLSLLCYAFARYLTHPVLQLQRAVDRFGRGDLTARARVNRGDELGSLAATFNRMADRIEILLSAERRLLLDISHELRSPLARMSVAIELARMGENVDEHIARIEKEAGRLNSLVGELLQVTRAEGDVAKLRVDTISLDQLVNEVVEDGRVEAESRGCSIELASEPATLQGDRELLRRAIENVLRNAIRYAPFVKVDVTRQGELTRVEIRDNGPGVPEESLPRIFDPFYRVEEDRGRASGGAGLGLAIARRAVELHHGTITARNSSPGLSVVIELPASSS